MAQAHGASGPVLQSIGRPLIEGYGAGGFRIAGTRAEGPVLVSARGASAWAVTGLGDASLESLRALLDGDATIEMLILGSGPSMALAPSALRDPLRARGIRLEVMATGAACRTFNVLVAERRPVGAALLPV